MKFWVKFVNFGKNYNFYPQYVIIFADFSISDPDHSYFYVSEFYTNFLKFVDTHGSVIVGGNEVAVKMRKKRILQFWSQMKCLRNPEKYHCLGIRV